jgi:ATP-dependent Clp protease ATP-binding subunit ClpB
VRRAAPAAERTATSTPGSADLVARYTRDLLAAAGAADPVIGRHAEVRRLLQVLERRSKHHPLLVGEPGVGKSAILRALARRVVAGDVPSNLASVRLLELDVGGVLAGAKLRGEVEDRVKALVRALADDRKNEPILVIEGLADLLGQGVAGAGLGDVLRSVLERGELRLIATTSPDGVRRMQDRDGALLRRYTPITIEPASIADTTEVLRGIVPKYEQHHGVEVREAALDAAAKLAARYVPDRFLPDAAVDLLDETAARKRVEVEGLPAALDDLLRRIESLRTQRVSLAEDTDRDAVEQRTRIDAELARLEPDVKTSQERLAAQRGARLAVASLEKEIADLELALGKARKDAPARASEIEFVQMPDVRRRLAAARSAAETAGPSAPRVVSEEDVAATLELWTGIPVSRMLEGEADKLLKMEERLRHRVVGQDEGLTALARAVRRGRLGLRDPGKPIGSFLFLGPSGVGKTELAKALAEFLFDDEQALTRLDMSEFMERHMAQRLIGAPPGYVDSEQGGFLTDAVRKRPYSVLLFDEIEKAHADVFNLLLQVLDDGRLTDGRGRTADFSNSVVIMTSNLGSGRILDADAKLFESEEGRMALREVLMDELKSHFRPEFLNRIDDVIVFRPLRKTDLRGIVDIQLRKLGRLLEPRRLSLRLSDAAKDRLVERSYEPAFGARPLRRTILRELQDPLAEAILTANYAEGSVIAVGVKDDAFTFVPAVKG